ncbi:MAG TPA: protein kinase [Steroidobacteraceae bacterium]|nr:protein kinase [Steroidobacteraceae bacterium]
MTAPSWVRVKELLHQALALVPESRAKFLDEVCASDLALRSELDSLLSVGDGLSAKFLESPPKGPFGVDDGMFGAAGLAEGQVFSERFRLIRRLGEGGMGQVWLAEQTAPVRRPVALKLIKAGMYDESVLHRFQAERQSLAIMDHPAIAKVFDAGITPQGQPYFVMEYVPGLPITEYCDQRKLNIRARLDLFIQACDGVQHAHQKAIIHRDLKPANILVIEVDGKPVPRIIDFGLAKATTSQLTDQTLYTRFGQFMGTPGYMSPEQVNPNIRDIDTRTDVYSLGVILYELLTGMQPFQVKGRHRPSLEEWLRQLREEEPRRPSSKLGADREALTDSAAARGTETKQLLSVLRGDLDWITMKALERDRERRYGTPAEMVSDLRHYLTDEPIVARPASSVYRIGKFIRRHRIAAVVAGLMAVLAILASGAGLIAVRQKHEAQYQEHQAEYQATQALQAQARLLTQAAAQRLKDSDLASAQGIILEVLTNPAFKQIRAPPAIGVFQDIRASDAQLAVLSGHGERVNSAVYSRDGTRILTASSDKTARIWDARTGTLLAVLSGHMDGVQSAAYSRDGTQILTISTDRTARIWSARTGAQLAVVSTHDIRPVRADFSPDGTRIVVASLDKAAHIWDARTGAELAVLSGHDDVLQCVAYSPDGTRIVTASRDKTARIWEARGGAPLLVLSGHEAMLLSARYSPDGMRIVTASADKTARVWDARTGALILVLAGHADRVFSAAYSPDGARLVTASDDKTARIWDARTGAPLAVLSGHGGFVRFAAFSPDGARIVTASYDKTARIWEARRDTQLSVLRGHGEGVAFANYSPDGARIVTASLDRTVRIWEANTGAQLGVYSAAGDFVIAATYSPDGAQIATGGALDKAAHIWDAHTWVPLATLSGHKDVVESTAYSPDGRHLATASLDGTARIWDARTGVQLALLSGHTGQVLSAAYSPDGRQVVTASFDKTARIWDASTGAQLAALPGHSEIVSSAAYSPDGRQLLTASFDKTARIWDARTGAPIVVLSGHAGPVQWAWYSPDGTRVVTASSDKTARIWDARTGAQLAVLLGHEDSIQSAAYSPDGTRIVTASLDKTARIWDAHVPASLDAQILWEASAVTDPLPEADRIDLGLPSDPRRRTWPANGSACDQAAAAVYDPDRLRRGALLGSITVDIANPACSAEIGKPDHAARSDYQMGRTLYAKGDAKGAERQFEIAVSKGHRAARIDLADLLVDVSSGDFDAGRAVPLYKKAWDDGVTIAAFKLAHLFEYGARPVNAGAGVSFDSDAAEAWRWYQNGADAGEPNALARFAEREEHNALAQTDASKADMGLLRAFALYAAAAERAGNEDWPDDAWRHWRYRRASLARLLARQGLMQQVADAYGAILEKGSPGLSGLVRSD